MVEQCPCCMPPWTVKTLPRFHNLVKLTDDGASVVWTSFFSDLATTTSGTQVSDLAIDPTAEFIYTSCLASPGSSSPQPARIRKLKILDGSQVWRNNNQGVGSNVHGIASCPNGDIVHPIYNSSDVTGPSRVKRIDSSNNTLWDVTAGIAPYSAGAALGICTDSSGGIYMPIIQQILLHNGTTTHYDSTGAWVWTTGHGNTSGNPQNIATDSNLICTVGIKGTGAFPDSTYVFDMSGVLQFTVDHGAAARACAFMSSGNFVTVGDLTGGVTTRCYDNTGAQQWTANHGANVSCVCIDENDNVYTGGDKTGGYSVRKYDDTGTLLWSFDYSLGSTHPCNAIAVDNAGHVYLGGNLVQV